MDATESFVWIKNAIEWVETNEIWLNIIISAVSAVFSIILTAIIIRQTSKLANQQSEQELRINQQEEKLQLELQRRQALLDTFEHRNTIYRAINKVFQLTTEYRDLFEKIQGDLEKKPCDKLFELFDLYRTTIDINVSETLWLFKQAEYVFAPNIHETIKQISAEFNEMTGSVAKLKVFPKILTPDELEKSKLELLADIYVRSQRINKHIYFIESIMPRELDIHNLYR